LDTILAILGYLLLALVAIGVLVIFIGLEQYDQAQVNYLNYLIDAKDAEVQRRREHRAKREQLKDSLAINPKCILDPFSKDDK